MASKGLASRVLELMKLQASIFNTNFNPLRQRLGNKVLRQRLKGPALAEYYPPRIRVVQELRREYPDWEVDDDKEDIRLDGIQLRKIRGKGAPKKRRTKEDSKQKQKRKPGGTPKA